MRLRQFVIWVMIFAAAVLAGPLAYERQAGAEGVAGGCVFPPGPDEFSSVHLVPLPIPDNDPIGVEDCITVDDPRTINRLTVALDISHTWVGDLVVTLTHEDTGTSVTLIDRPGAPAIDSLGCPGDDIDVTLDDDAALPLEDECAAGVPTIVDTFAPSEPLSAFAHEGIAGTWTLHISDHFVEELGALEAWSLIPSFNRPCHATAETGVVFAAQLKASLPIPDNDVTGVGDCITINDTRSINHLSVAVEISHTRVEDLVVTLTHMETGKTTLLLSHPRAENGDPCDGDDIDVILDSSENLHVDFECSPGTPTILGRFRPTEVFFHINGDSIAGTWTLRVFDEAAGQLGALNDWSIIASLDGPPAVCPPATIFGDAFADALPAPLAIPDGFMDGRSGMVEDCITVEDDTNIEALVVTLDIEHTAVGDVIVTLTHEDTGSSVDLLFGLDCDGDDIVVTLDDAAGSPVDDQCGAGSPAITGTFRPSQRLSEFDDESIAGTWVLEVGDGQPTETGALNGWSLNPGQPVACSSASGSGHVFAAQLNAPLPIPDDDPDGATNCITISDDRPINSLSVAVNISHTRVADLSITLTHVGTDSGMLLMFHPTAESGEPCGGDDIDVILGLSGPGVDAACSPGTPTLSGTFRRTMQFLPFSGESMAGTWTLKVQDVNEGQLGTLNDWSIIAGLEGPPSVCPTAVGSGDSFSDSLPAPLAIPGDDPVGVMDCITIEDDAPILDLDVALEIDHTFVGQLVIRLTHDDTGTTSVLMDRPGVPCEFCGCGNDDIDAVLNDEASSLVEDECADSSPTIFGEFRPNEALSAFDGESLAGTWTLHIVDDIESSQGDLIGWTLIAGPEDEATVTPAVTPQATGTPPPPPPGGPVGDANCDGTVNAIDAALILQFGAGLIDALPCANLADANQDSDVTAIDAALVLQFTAGLLGNLPP